MPASRGLGTVFCQVIVVVCSLRSAASTELQTAHLRNFDQVDAGIYRGGAPSAVGLTELHALGVKVILDLREEGSATRTEGEESRHLGMRYVNLPFKPMSAPSQADVEKAIALLVRASPVEPVFVHCRRGKDRTGTVIACYRIQHDGWDNKRALTEAGEHGMSHAERAMRSFVMHFSASAAGAPLLLIH